MTCPLWAMAVSGSFRPLPVSTHTTRSPFRTRPAACALMSPATLDAARATFHKGQHGYDPAYPSMHGILIASGPAFRAGGLVIDSVENVHVYNLLCAVLGLKPAPNDGDNRLVKALLK